MTWQSTATCAVALLASALAAMSFALGNIGTGIGGLMGTAIWAYAAHQRWCIEANDVEIARLERLIAERKQHGDE